MNTSHYLALLETLNNRVVRRINVHTGRITELDITDPVVWPFPFKNSKPSRARVRKCLEWAKSRMGTEFVIEANALAYYTGTFDSPIGDYLKSQLLISVQEHKGRGRHYKSGKYTINVDGYNELTELKHFYQD